jgi:hypothetical protein
MTSGHKTDTELEQLQEELWRVWRTIKKLPIDDPLSPSDLSVQGKKLLEAAIAGKRITELEVGIHLSGLESTFNDSIRDWKRDKLFWACQVFLSPDGSLIPKEDPLAFRNLFKKYCDENSIDLKDLEAEYLREINTLPFFPVYDWLFLREMELSGEGTRKSSRKPSSSADATKLESVEQGREKRLKSFLRDIFSGSKTLLFIFGILVVGGGVKYCVNDHLRDVNDYFRSQRGEVNQLLKGTAMVNWDFNDKRISL